MTAAVEKWLPVVGHESTHEVSSLGRVRSTDREIPYLDGRIHRHRGRVMRPTLKPNGYFRVCLNGSYLYVHRLVLTTFGGPNAEGQECRHLNGDRSDNRASNLAWGSRSRNLLDAVEHGTHHWAKKTHCPQGHPYSPENTHLYRNRRNCRTCNSARSSRARRRPIRLENLNDQ